MVPRRLSAQRVTRGSDGVEIAYATHGAGSGEAPAVVLVQGWAGNRTFWDHQVDYFAERNFVIAVDLGGHGASGLGRDEWSLAAFGDDVLAVVDDLGTERFSLVGHSMGGDAIVHAARRLGDRVVGLVWVDAFRSLGDEPVSTHEQVEAFVAPFRADFEAAVARFVRNLLPAAAKSELVDRITTDITAPLVAINPGIAPTDVDSLRRHGVEPDRACRRRLFPDARGPGAVQPDTRHDAGVLCRASPNVVGADQVSRIFQKLSLRTILPSSPNVQRSQPRTSMRSPSTVVPVSVHSETARFPRTKWSSSP